MVYQAPIGIPARGLAEINCHAESATEASCKWTLQGNKV